MKTLWKRDQTMSNSAKENMHKPSNYFQKQGCSTLNKSPHSGLNIEATNEREIIDNVVFSEGPEHAKGCQHVSTCCDLRLRTRERVQKHGVDINSKTFLNSVPKMVTQQGRKLYQTDTNVGTTIGSKSGNNWKQGPEKQMQ